jgi:uncharacterized protein (TIGR00725 family)
MKPIIAVSGSAKGNITKSLEKAAFIMGQEIAKRGAILLTGACPGLPYEAAKGARSVKGFVIGISPAENKKEHQLIYKEFLKKDLYSLKNFDVIIYTGFGFKGRNVVFIRSADAIISIAGRTGTLNEFTIAYDEGKFIGILQPGGVSQLIPEIVKISGKGIKPVIYEKDPKKLVARIFEIL